jgi:hypothetical protein
MKIHVLAKNSRLASLTSGFPPSQEELVGTREINFRKNSTESAGKY